MISSSQVELRQRLDPSQFDLPSIDLYVTRHCNQECSFCFHSDEYFSGNEMRPEMALAVVDWAARANIKDVAILGGEPTLYRELTNVLEHARRRQLTTRIVTNGLKPFRQLLGKIQNKDLLSAIHLSIDGLEDAHDAIRGTGSFMETLASIRMAVAAGLPTTINVTVHQDNIADVPKIAQMCDELGVVRLNVHWMSPVGRAALDGSPEHVGSARWAELIDWTKAFRAAHDSLRVDCQIPFVESNQSCAIAEKSNLQFMPDGSVYSCGLLVSSHRSGYVFEHNELWKRSSASELDLLSGNQSCTSCPARAEEECDSEYVPGCIYPRATSASSTLR